MSGEIGDCVRAMVAGMRGEKRAARGTVKQLVRFLGGGAKGRQSLASLQGAIARWLASGSAEAPRDLQRRMGHFFHGLGDKVPKMTPGRVYGVLDPSGRLESARLARALEEFPGMGNSGDWARGVKFDVGGDMFEPLPVLLASRPGEYAARRAASLRGSAPSAAELTRDQRKHLAFMERMGGGPTYSAVKRWTEPLTGTSTDFRPQRVTVQLRPGETPVQAVRRDLMDRVWPGTPLAGQLGTDVLRHNRIALNGDGHAVEDGYFTLPEHRTLPKLSNGIGKYLSRKINSGAGPYGVQTAAALSGNGVTYYPHVAMHEMGHALQEWGNLGKPGAWRRNHAAAEESIARFRHTPRKERAGLKLPSRLAQRSSAAFGSRYVGGAGVAPLPAAYSWQRDPVQVFRQLSPEVYGEVAADVNAFGRNSRAWPQSIRRALGTYLAGVLRDGALLDRMPGATHAQKMRALREYANMARRFTAAPEIPYTTAWGGVRRWNPQELH